MVNGTQITRDQLARECLRRFGEEVLENVVNRYLILQACKQKGIQITADDINKEVARLAGKLGLSPDRLLQVLRDERNITPDQYRRDIVWPMLALRRLAADEIAVSKPELAEAFQTEYGPRVQVRMISANTRQKAEQIRAEAMAKPAEFGNLAKKHSIDVNSAAAHGLIPPVRMHTGTPEVEQAVFRLKDGEISPVVEAAGQFLIFKCDRHIPATRVLQQQRGAIEQQLTERIRQRKLRTAASQLFKQLQDKSKVVNVYNDAKLRKAMPGVAATINGQRITLSHLAEQCMLRHGQEVLDGEIDREVLRQALHRRGQQVAEADIDQEINRSAQLYGYAKADGTPDREAWLKHVTSEEKVSVDVYVRDAVWPTAALTKLVEGDVKITDQDLQKAFVANYGPRVQVLAIVVGNRHTANKVWKMAKDNPDEQFFGELAHQYSIEPISRSNFGQIPPIARFGGQPLVEQEAFSLGSNNKLSGVLSIGDKYIILWYLGRTEPVVKQLNDVREELVKDLRDKKQRLAMAQKFDGLIKQARIDNFLAGTTQSGKPAQAASPARPPATAARPTSPRAATRR